MDQIVQSSTLKPPQTDVIEQKDPFVELAQTVAILRARVTACELDIEHIRNKVLRRDQKTPQRSGAWRIGQKEA